MITLDFDSIINSDLLLYHYIRGSHAYGLAKPDGTSDIDTAAVYLEPMQQLLGLGLDFQSQVADKRNDNVAYGLNKYLNLLLDSNPNILESLFIPERCVLKTSYTMELIKSNRDKFITKRCFKSFLGYSYEQIVKCRGLNKRFLQEKVERKTPLDFCYTFNKQGSTKIMNWLEYRHLKQQYCGLVKIPNMKMYGIYYDWYSHFKKENVSFDDLKWLIYSRDLEHTTSEYFHMLQSCTDETKRKELEENLDRSQYHNMIQFIINSYKVTNVSSFQKWYESLPKDNDYKGIIGMDGQSNEVRLSSVSKGQSPICYMYYGENEYSTHCREYREQKEWEENRNPERYNENKGKLFDRKNVAHAVRLLHMGIEIGKGEGFNVDRTNIDRDFIMNIRLGNTSYEEIMEYIQQKKEEVENVFKTSTLPESIDADFLNDLLLEIRKKQVKMFSF